MHSRWFQPLVRIAVCDFLVLQMLLSARDITAQGTTAAQPTTGPPRNKTPIYIAGFFPFEDYFNSVMVNSTQIAIDHVNEFEGLLADYELKMIWAWAQVSHEQTPFTCAFIY